MKDHEQIKLTFGDKAGGTSFDCSSFHPCGCYVRIASDGMTLFSECSFHEEKSRKAAAAVAELTSMVHDREVMNLTSRVEAELKVRIQGLESQIAVINKSCVALRDAVMEAAEKCEHCDGRGQDNDGEQFINEPCPKCFYLRSVLDGKNFDSYIHKSELEAVEARVNELLAQRENAMERSQTSQSEIEQFLTRLAREGGSIVSSDGCTELEIALAQACSRFLIIDGLGFIHQQRKVSRADMELAELLGSIDLMERVEMGLRARIQGLEAELEKEKVLHRNTKLVAENIYLRDLAERAMLSAGPVVKWDVQGELKAAQIDQIPPKYE